MEDAQTAGVANPNSADECNNNSSPTSEVCCEASSPESGASSPGGEVPSRAKKLNNNIGQNRQTYPLGQTHTPLTRFVNSPL